MPDQSTLAAIAASLRDSIDRVSSARHDYPPLHDFQAALTDLEQTTARHEKLEALATAVREGIDGLPDHPWIPGATCRPVRDALLALDGTLPPRDLSVPFG